MSFKDPPAGELLLKEYLEPRGISQRELAREVGAHPSTINRIIKGRCRISRSMDSRLGAALGTSKGYWIEAQAKHEIEMIKNEG